jgi:hypothetical protein
MRPGPGTKESIVVFTTMVARTGPALVRLKEAGDDPEADATTR